MSPAPRIPKWRPTPPPPPSSPKILLFPRSRRARRKQATHARRHSHHQYPSYKGKLENLFDRENDESPTLDGPPLESWNSRYRESGVGRRGRVERREDEDEEEEEECGQCNSGVGFEEEKWKFQAEILRAECNFLRLEREFALKKLEKNRVKMERTLRSAVQALVSGRKKIFEGKDANTVLVEEIKDLAEKLEELQKSSSIKGYEVPKCSNLDTKACLLQRRLEKLGGRSEEIACDQSSLPINISRDDDKEISSITNCETENKPTDVDQLGKKMAGQSKDMLDRSEEEYNYNSYLCSAVNSSVSSSASTSKRVEFPEVSSHSTRQFYQEPVLHDNKCSGRCKAVVRRIMEQVRAETEQWSQMQEMLRQVRGEMEELQASRDFWESQAQNSDYEIQSLRHSVQEWKEKALGYENKAKELKLELSALKEEITKAKAEPFGMQDSPLIPLGKQIKKEKLVLSHRWNIKHHVHEEGCKSGNALDELSTEENNARSQNKDLPPLSLGKQLANEMKKRMLLHRLKENSRTCKKSSPKEPSHSTGVVVTECSPLRDIGNLMLTP